MRKLFLSLVIVVSLVVGPSAFAASNDNGESVITRIVRWSGSIVRTLADVLHPPIPGTPAQSASPRPR